jgi:hypothetical protein
MNATPTITWTGQRMRGTGLLYQDYQDLANVTLEGRWIGEVLHLPNGYYRPRIDGIRGEDCSTPDSALREVAKLHKKFRS